MMVDEERIWSMHCRGKTASEIDEAMRLVCAVAALSMFVKARRVHRRMNQEEARGE